MCTRRGIGELQVWPEETRTALGLSRVRNGHHKGGNKPHDERASGTWDSIDEGYATWKGVFLMGNTTQEVEDALNAVQKLVPLLGLIPGFSSLTPFIGLLPVAIQAVDTVAKSTGVPTTTAVTTVAAHLTPGMPNAPALGAVQPAGTPAA
jgi:hypothetical protein